MSQEITVICEIRLTIVQEVKMEGFTKAKVNFVYEGRISRV